MKAHYIVMSLMVGVALALIVFAPALNVGIGFGLLFLICPLIMLGMMFFMGSNHDRQ